jgi:hypothetical protein
LITLVLFELWIGLTSQLACRTTPHLHISKVPVRYWVELVEEEKSSQCFFFRSLPGPSSSASPAMQLHLW